MGVLQRMKDMTKASVNELLDKLEDPVMMLNQYLRDMEEEITLAEVSVARQVANERKLKERLDEARRMSGERGQSAESALVKGQEAVARQALEEKLYFDQKMEEYADMYVQSKAQAGQFTEQLHQMKDDFYNMRNKRNELVSRVQVAKVQKQMVQINFSNTIEGGNASKGFHRMEEKIIQMEVESETTRNAYTPRGLTNPVDPAKQEKVDEQLEALKAKLTAVGT